MKHITMKKGVFTLALLGALVAGGAANAQGGGGFGGGGRAQMTPEQMAQMQQRMQQMREQQMRTQLNALGYSTLVQDAAVEFSQGKETAQTALREKGTAMATALTAAGGVVTDAPKQLADLKALVDAEKARRTAAEKDLDDKVGYSKDPKLELYLRLTGLVGDDSTILGIGGGGGGRGGRGGGFGGGAGGFGGGGFGGGGFGGGAGGGRRGGGQGGAGGGGGMAPAAAAQ